MKTMRYDDEMYMVAETAEEFISMLREGDEIMSNRKWSGDNHSYYCGSVPTYTYSEKNGEWLRNAEDVKRAMDAWNDLELDVWRDSEGVRFFYNANGADLTWHFEV